MAGISVPLVGAEACRDPNTETHLTVLFGVVQDCAL